MNDNIGLKRVSLILPSCLLIACLIVLFPNIRAMLASDYLITFKNHFLGILLEAIPFVLLGALLSSFIHLIMPEDFLGQKMPKNPLAGIVIACVLGTVFPVCECGMIPLIRRLVQKGMPVYIAAVFLLSGPIVNPVVFSATAMAFQGHPEMVYARLGIALVTSSAVGLILYFTVGKNPLRHTVASTAGHEHASVKLFGGGHSFRAKSSAFFQHATDDFMDAGKYLIAGCLITAVLQTFVAHNTLAAFGNGPISSYAFMMGLGFILSLCSTSDAFVASTFMNTFSHGSLLSFLVLGPMLDFKNMLMLLSAFKTKFVLGLMLIVPPIVFTFSVLTDRFFIP
ncbi:permease [Paenibacillus caui]|uniref:permease n=1 Tax=Paenibacillus caui TaxID=2873927 RepID=UPI001CA800BB|nr:permease [Paenibacillus caui]